jgi:uncharacterized membrane protein (UPF0182 family)
MGRHRHWAYLAVGAGLLLLLGGRWLAVRTADRLWAEALGVAEAHAGMAELRLILVLIAFTGAAVWCLGNLFAIYRSIGSLHVPRRLGNLEFVEALPPRSLVVIVVLLGLALAMLLSHGSADWWRSRALADLRPDLGLQDPILGRDLGFYLFTLPWRRTIHGFVTAGTGLMLGVTVVLYAAVGAVRWADRQLNVTDLARGHVGTLLLAFALSLYWGYRLEPVEYVSGVHDVPLDLVLLEIRLPAARLLGALALVAAGGSLLWIWTQRVAVVVAPWGLLAVVSFAAHYLVPAFAAAVRTREELVLADVEEARPAFEAAAFGVPVPEVTLEISAISPPSALAQHRDELATAPIWDAFAVTAFLNRAVSGDPTRRFRVGLGVYEDGAARVPVLVGVLEPDLEAASDEGRDLTWEAIHAGTYAAAGRATAIYAHRATDRGLPLFVPDLAEPDSAVATVTPLSLRDTVFWFAPGLERYAVTTDRSLRGVGAGRLGRRLALAWVLQSPSLLTNTGVADSTLVVWHRAVAERLERFAPFARFGRAYAAVTDGRLYWLSSGYVSSKVFPVAPPARWRGESVRALSAGLLGVVDAASGETRVFLMPDADPVSVAWAERAPDIVSPWDRLAPALRAHVRYPEELFRVQRTLLFGGREPPNDVVEGPGPDAYWWVGRTPADSIPRLRLLAPLTNGDAGKVQGLTDAAVRDGRRRLTVLRFAGEGAVANAGQVAEQLSLVRSDTVGVPGQMRLVPLRDGLLALQAFYRTPAAGEEPPRLAEVAVAWGETAARGSNLLEAVRRLTVLRAPPRAGQTRWIEARRWFERMEAARRAGDWQAFGDAYDALRGLLVGGDDTVP